MRTFHLPEFPECPTCGRGSSARYVSDLDVAPPHVRQLARHNPVRRCGRCGTAWHQVDRYSDTDRRVRMYYIVRLSDLGEWLESPYLVQVVLLRQDEAHPNLE